MEGVLAGLKVVAWEHWVAVPGATAIMADWGADVIKIEDPRGGDPARGYQVRTLAPSLKAEPPLNPLFEMDNRNKRSIAVDLRTEKGREIGYKLIERADIFLSNIRPPVRKRVGFDYESLSRVNPRLIYVSLTGYGEVGPDCDRPGYDYGAFWARSGIMATLGEPDSPVVPQRPGMGDHTTSYLVVASALGALRAREITGEGQEVRVCLYHSGVWVDGIDIQTSLMTGENISRISIKAPGNPLFNPYKAKDGKWFQLLLLQPDRYWSDFCKAIGREELENDPRFNTTDKRRENSQELVKILEEIFATRTREEWGKIFDEHGLIWAPVQTSAEVTEDAQALINDFFAEVDHPSFGKTRYVLSPTKFSKTPAQIKTPAPQLGQHTEEILLELGYSWEDIAKFKESGVIL